MRRERGIAKRRCSVPTRSPCCA
ncbi:BnaA06g23010D [Brassica napus]|uniref:BnaA06g23010D protein n=1 Tax=Brassica napus TaxID=3708 RepID=A0A078HYV3_BRANA|nr:BnaA06g23010D [Brassica napus]